LESDLHGGFLFIVMEFIHGHSLADEMTNKGPISAEVLLQVATRVLLGLKAAHGKNAFHRDLSPDNIILRDGDPHKATRRDFGIAKDVNEGAKTVVGDGFAGKYQYAAPEQMEGKADARSDLYSLGMTLLGGYRGQSPSAGSSLMEIISAKAVKPDISDMDGPLHDLVSYLVEPNSIDRPQSAIDALTFMKTGKQPSDAMNSNSDKTVIVPRVAPAVATAPAAEGTIESLKSASKESPKNKVGLIAILLVLLVVGTGAWFTGIIGSSPKPDEPVIAETINPALPFADPYVLSIERTSKSDPLALRGNLPSAEAIPIISTALEDKLDTFAVLTEVTPSDGIPFEGWAEKIVEIAVNFNQLQTWSVMASGKTVTLTGQAQNDLEKTALLNAVQLAIDGSELTIVDNLTIEISAVDLADISLALQALQTCGPLKINGGTDGKVSADDKLGIFGKVANGTDVSRVQALLGEMAPDRPVVAELTTLNNSVCSALQILPETPSSKLSFDYTLGTSGAVVENDTYHIGENPVIDVELDAAISGFLSVIYVDLSDQVYHLLPHQSRTENNLQSIGTVLGNKRRVRTAFALSEASVAKLGFQVVEPLGNNLLLAIVTPEPLFEEVRPRAESNAAFLTDLKDKLQNLDGETAFVAYRPLITKP
jgi:serine/threonine-protein kinase